MSPRRALVATLLTAPLVLALAGTSLAQSPPQASTTKADDQPAVLASAAAEAERQLHQSFANLTFEDFSPSPVKGPIYQASAGNRTLYYAPESGHILFATVYDTNGVNVTALAEGARVSKRLSAIDPASALAIGPADAPTVIEFTDPDCPYCRALDRFWASKQAEGKKLRRLIYFVSGIHPEAAAKAEHILCSPDPVAAFKAMYSGAAPTPLITCAKGHAKVAADAALVAKVGITGTPTLIVDGKLISGFQQGELEAFLASHAGPAPASAPALTPAKASATRPPIAVRPDTR